MWSNAYIIWRLYFDFISHCQDWYYIPYLFTISSMASAAALTLRTVVVTNRLCGTSYHQLSCVSLLFNYQQTRRAHKDSEYKFSKPWHVRKWNYAIQEEGLTKDNEEFIKQVVVDNYKQQDSPLKEEPWLRGEYLRNTRRCGVLAIKLGVLPQWTKDGMKISTTLLQVVDNHVIRYSSPEEYEKSAGWKPVHKNYGSVVVGALSCDPRMFKKSYNSIFAEAGVPPKRKLTRFLVTPNSAIQPGTALSALHFRVGDYVDVQAKTIDHGFQGVVKRWGMKGMPASHGVTKAHRKMGSTGGGGDKSGIWKGKKMPGHMGNEWRILKGLKIWRINTKYNVLYVQGYCLPGSVHTMVRVYDTILPHKRPTPDDHPPMPTWYPEDEKQPIPEDLYDEELFRLSDPTIEY